MEGIQAKATPQDGNIVDALFVLLMSHKQNLMFFLQLGISIEVKQNRILKKERRQINK